MKIPAVSVIICCCSMLPDVCEQDRVSVRHGAPELSKWVQLVADAAVVLLLCVAATAKAIESRLLRLLVMRLLVVFVSAALLDATSANVDVGFLGEQAPLLLMVLENVLLVFWDGGSAPCVDDVVVGDVGDVGLSVPASECGDETAAGCCG